MSTSLLVDILGWIGAIVLLVAYALVSKKQLEGDSTLYQVLNLIGSVTLMINGFYYGANPSGFLNIVWGSVAVYTLWTVRSKASHGSHLTK
ncbi:MAG: hypothetical protein IIB03_00205 [Acidobacteria bacterium]|nr:hypothetical protein [Acidobacteriota bacterium]